MKLIFLVFVSLLQIACGVSTSPSSAPVEPKRISDRLLQLEQRVTELEGIRPTTTSSVSTLNLEPVSRQTCESANSGDPAQSVEGASWSRPENVSKSQGFQSHSPLLAISPDGTRHLAWGEYDGSVTRFRYAYGSPDNGWAAPTSLVGHDLQLSNVMLVADGFCALHLGYEFEYFMYRHWTPTQDHWQETRPFDGSVIEGPVFPLGLAVDSESRVHILARARGGGVKQGGVWHVEGDGRTWSVEPVHLKNVASPSNDVGFAILPNDEIHWIWWDGDVRKAHHWRKVNGQWGEITGELLADIGLPDPGEGSSINPQVTVGRDGSLHLAVAVGTGTGETHQTEVYHASFLDGAWRQAQLVSIDDGIWSAGPSLAVDNSGSVHVAWYDNDSGKGGSLLYRRTYPDGRWSDIEQVAAGPMPRQTALQVGPDNIHLVWSDCPSPGLGNSCEILYASKALIPVAEKR